MHAREVSPRGELQSKNRQAPDDSSFLPVAKIRCAKKGISTSKKSGRNRGHGPDRVRRNDLRPPDLKKAKTRQISNKLPVFPFFGRSVEITHAIDLGLGRL